MSLTINTKADYFLLWSNGKTYEQKILQKINNNFKIIRIVRYRSILFPLRILKLYKYSFIPKYFLFKKLFYLIKYEFNFLAVEVINTNPAIEHQFNGIFRTYFCKKILNLKYDIRKEFQKNNSDEHIIHSTDTYHDYLAIKNLINDNSNYLSTQKYITQSIPINNLYCSQTQGSTFNYKEIIVPLEQSYHYKFLKFGQIMEYNNYIKTFTGTSMRYYHSDNKFLNLLESIKNNNIKINIRIKKKGNKFLILDGLHRASIFLFLDKKNIMADLYE